jgi:hypothetical protein
MMAGLQAMKAFRTKTATISNSVAAIADAGWSWTAGDLAAADRAKITAHTNPICVTWDGTAPAATTGMYVAVGATVEIEGNANILALKFIRQGAGDGVASVTLEKW